MERIDHLTISYFKPLRGEAHASGTSDTDEVYVYDTRAFIFGIFFAHLSAGATKVTVKIRVGDYERTYTERDSEFVHLASKLRSI